MKKPPPRRAPNDAKPPARRRSLPVNNAQPGLHAPARDVARLFQALDTANQFPAPPGEISIAFLDAAAMGALHARYFGDPVPTDVITFPGDPGLGVAGEICVCAEVARDYAQKHGRNFARELTLYLLHGYLHLAGYEDRNTGARTRMRRAERRGMRIIEVANAVPAFRWSRTDPDAEKPRRAERSR